MYRDTDNTAHRDENRFTVEFSDEELEAAAGMTKHAAMTFPGAPTVSVVVLCCGNDYRTEPEQE
jgi:hypothetical protein